MRPARPSLILVVASAAAIAGCTPPRASTSVAPADSAVRGSRPRRNQSSKLILAEEIQQSGAATAWDAISSLRPMWLRKRGPQSLQNEGDVLVYVGDARMGTLDALREIAAASIASMRYLDAKEANYKFGQGHPYGAIVISTVFPAGK